MNRQRLFESQLHFWTHMLDEAFPEDAMLVEGKHWPEDYIKAALNMLKNDGKYADDTKDPKKAEASRKIKADVQKIAQRFRMVLHGNSPLGYFNTVVRWYSEDPDGFVKPLLDNGQPPNDKLEAVLQSLLNFHNNQALVDKYGQQVKSGMDLAEFSSIMKKVSDEDAKKAAKVKFKVEDRGYKIIPIMSYEQLHEQFAGDKTGYPTKPGSGWCHTNGSSTYTLWTSSYTKFFFVIAKDNWQEIKPHDNPQKTDNAYDEYGLSLMAILVSREGELLRCTLRWNHVVEPKYTMQGREVDRAFISYAELSQATGLDVEAEVKKELVKLIEKFKNAPKGEKVYEGLEGICFARDHFYWYDRDFNPIDPPDEINDNFDFWGVRSIVSLEGSPRVVNGNFNCPQTNITSLENGPQIVTGYFRCSNTPLTSLAGAPKEVRGYFDCSYTNITSLKGIPKKLGDSLYCSHTRITSLRGSPKEINGDFNCSDTNIISLENGPRIVKQSFRCNNTKITSLEGAPKSVGKYFDCENCKFLKSINGAPARIDGSSYFPKSIPTDQVNAYKEWLETNPTENYPG